MGAPFDWGLGRRHLQQLARGHGRLGQGQLQPRRVGPAARVPLAQQHDRGLAVHRAALGVQGVPAAGDRHHRHPAARDAAAARSRCRWRTPCPTATPRPRPRASAPRSTPARRTWSRCCGRTGCSPRSPPPATLPAGQQPARSLARLARVARGDLELALPRLELVPAVLPRRRRLLLVPAARRATWCSAGGSAAASSSRPPWTSRPRAATSFRPSSGSTPAAPTTCAASSATSSAPVVYVVPKGEVDSAASQGRATSIPTR